METIEVLHPIREELLSQRYYFQSLVDQALLCQLLSEKELMRIQTDLLGLLAVQSDKWTKGESSSLPIEKGQEIMSSILFVIGLQLKTYHSPERAIAILKSESLHLLFEKGLKIVFHKMAVAKQLQRHIMKELFVTPNVFYRSTIVDGIHGFFKLYRPQFSAFEIHIHADYPVFMDGWELDGIEFIEQYLRCIDAENAFCNGFASEDVHRLLCGLVEDYHLIPMNLFEYVMLAALGIVLQKRSPCKLDVSKEEVGSLYSLFEGQSVQKILYCLQGAVSELKKYGLLPEATRRYVTITLPKFAKRIHQAVELHTLDKVFLVAPKMDQGVQMTFDNGEPMDNRAYQRLVARVLSMEDGNEKVSLILREVHSLVDFMDILSVIEFDSHDYDRLLDQLPFSIFVVLLSKYPHADFLDEKEMQLYRALQRKRLRLSVKENKQVEQTLRALQMKEV